MECKKYNETKTLWAYLGSVAASGGYYIACSTENIIANRNTLTGSIGVIAGQSVDLSEFMTKHGIKMTTFTAGKNKNMLNIDQPVTPEQKEIMQSVADECYEQFTQIVADGRKLPIETVCHFCGSSYPFDKYEITDLLIEAHLKEKKEC